MIKTGDAGGGIESFVTNHLLLFVLASSILNLAAVMFETVAVI